MVHDRGNFQLPLFFYVLRGGVQRPAGSLARHCTHEEAETVLAFLLERNRRLMVESRWVVSALQPSTHSRSLESSGSSQYPHIFKGDRHKSVQVRLPESDSRLIVVSRGAVSPSCSCASSSYGNKLRLCACTSIEIISLYLLRFSEPNQVHSFIIFA